MDILRLLPIDQYNAALQANAPTAANPFATIADVAGGATLSATLTVGDTMLAGQKIRTSNVTATNKFAIESIDGGGSPDVLSIYRDNGGSHDNSARIDLTSGQLNLTHRGTSSNTLKIDQANGFEFSSGNSKPVIVKINSGFVMESGAALRYATFAITSLTAPQTYTFQNGTGTVAFLTDIPAATGNGIYDGSDSLSGVTNVTQGSNTLNFLVGASSGKVTVGQILNHGALTIYDSTGGEKIRLDAGGSSSYFMTDVGINMTGGVARLSVKAAGTGTDQVVRFRNFADSLNLFTVLGNGNVGINRDTPTQKLEVGGNIWARNGFAQFGGLTYRSEAGVTIDVGASTAFQFFHCYHSGGTRFEIGRDGSMGVGGDANSVNYVNIDTTAVNHALSFKVGLNVFNDFSSDISATSYGAIIKNEGATLTTHKPNIGLQLEADNHADGLNYALVIPSGKGSVAIGALATVNSLFEVTGDIETIGSTEGLIVLDRTNATRYRIYTDGGVVFTEVA